MSDPKRPVTLSVVAELAGVSPATASRALSGKETVAPALRERVKLIADALDYRPNRAARSLAGASMSLLGLVLGATTLEANPYSARLVDAMAQAAEDVDHGLLVVMSKSEPARGVNNLIRDGMVDGIILSSVAYAEPWAENLLATSIPIVSIGPHPVRDDLHVVSIENRESSARLVDYLFDTGCSRLGMIAGPETRVDAQERLEGFLEAHRRRGITPDGGLVQAGDFSFESGRTAARALAERGVDAILAANDLSALGALRALDELEMSVPDNVSVVGFDGSATDHPVFPKLTTMVQPLAKMAKIAIDQVLSAQPDESATTHTVEPKLFVGETTRSTGRAGTRR